MSHKWQVLTCAAFLSACVGTWAVSPVAFDDAFITYRYARHLVEGQGIVFNPGEYVEGYTNFLWVLISAAAIRIGCDPFVATRALGIVAYLGCVLIALLASFRVARVSGPFRSGAVALLIAVLVTSRDVARLAGSGLETFFVSAGLLGTGVAFHLFTPSRGAELGWSILPAVAVLTRLDALLGVAASIAATIVHAPPARSLFATLARRYSLPLGSVVALSVWRFSYYGRLIPNAFYAKGAAGWHVWPGLMYVFGYLANSPFAIVLVLLAIFGLWACWHTEWRGWQLFLCAFFLLHVGYIVKVGGDFMYYRFMFEALPFLVCAAAGGLTLIPTPKPVTFAAAGTCVLLSVTPRYVEREYGMQSLWEMNQYVEVGREAGTRLKEVLPPSTVVATTLAGTVPYYSMLRTVDQWGLNDEFVASLPETRRFRRGHLKLAPADYLQDRQVNLVINHPTICSCGRPCDEGLPNVFVKLSGDRCLLTFYLVRRPELTRYFCENPDRFVLQNVRCPTP